MFAFVTQAEHLMAWWGPEGMFIPEGVMDFTAPGPWFSVMENKKGDRFKVSGDVISVVPLKEVVFTWGWHDENDVRGDETTVRFTLEAVDDSATQMTLIHSGFTDAAAMGGHEGGWTSSLRKLGLVCSEGKPNKNIF